MAPFDFVPSDSKVLFISTNNGDETEFKANHKGDITILLPDDHTKISSFEDSSFGAVLGVGPKPFSSRFCELVFKVLKPGSGFSVHVPKQVASEANKTLVFSGFSDISSSDDGDAVVVTGLRPSWEASASAPLSFLKKKKKDDSKSAANNSSGTTWNLGGDDLADDDIELEDEDDLLDNEVDKVDVVALKEEYEKCGTSGKPTRKACKDCSCGLKEMQDAGETEAAPPVSSCGSCGLGDAFRCSTCPYLGKPAFQKGNVVKLSL